MNRGLSRERIVEAALEVVAEHGLSKLSMRRIAGALDVEAMSLYRWVKHKDDLLAALHDHLIAGVTIPGAGTWQERTAGLARNFRDTLLAHRPLVPLLASRAATTPQALRVLEAGVAVLTDQGWSEEQAVNGFQTVFCFVVGHALFHTEGGQRDALEPWASNEFDAGLAILLAGLEAHHGGGGGVAGGGTPV